MNVLFRADASISIGAGHVMRCLTLAKALTKQGFQCHFACKMLEGNLVTFIQEQGFHVFTLASDVIEQTDDANKTLQYLECKYDLLIVDHYQLAAPFCSLLREKCRFVMVIDDLANREHDCDLLLDQNYLPDAHHRYDHLIPKSCNTLIGPQYALLRDEFYQTKKTRLANHILVNFGGSDEQNLTEQVIDALALLKLDAHSADIVIGANNPWRAQIERKIATLPNVTLHIQCNNMAALMCKARLMLGSGGASHWERCITALPSLIVTVADNQQATTAYLDKLGACVWLGQPAEVSPKRFAEQLSYYLSRPALLNTLSENAAKIVPKDAGTPLVVNEIITMIRGRHGHH